MRSKFLTTTFLLLFISIGYLTTDIYLPSLPNISEYFRVNEGDAQLTLFSYLLSFSFAPLIFGPASDHFGRKTVVILGLGVALAATIGCFVSNSIYALIGFRFIQGIGTGAAMISTRSMVVDLFTGKELAKQITYITMFMPIVLAIAPTIGGILQESYGWRSVFLFLIFYLIFLICIILNSKETLKTYSDNPISKIFASYCGILKNRLFLLFGVGLAFPTIGMFAYLTASPFLFQEIVGLSPAEYGVLAIYLGGAIMIASFVNSKLLSRFSIESIMKLGSCCMIASGLLMFAFYYLEIINTWSILLPSLLFYGCVPFSIANAASKSMSHVKENFGAANGVITATQFLAGAFGSLIFSMIPENDALPLSLTYFFVGVISLMVLTYASRKEAYLSK